MTAIFDEVMRLVEQLDAQEKNLLIYRLRVEQTQQRMSDEPNLSEPSQHNNTDRNRNGWEYLAYYPSLTREELLAEVEALRTTPVDPTAGLLGKYANPNVPEVSEEEFHAQMNAIATEWEQELDEFSPKP